MAIDYNKKAQEFMAGWESIRLNLWESGLWLEMSSPFDKDFAAQGTVTNEFRINSISPNKAADDLDAMNAAVQELDAAWAKEFARLEQERKNDNKVTSRPLPDFTSEEKLVAQGNWLAESLNNQTKRGKHILSSPSDIKYMQEALIYKIANVAAELATPSVFFDVRPTQSKHTKPTPGLNKEKNKFFVNAEKALNDVGVANGKYTSKSKIHDASTLAKKLDAEAKLSNLCYAIINEYTAQAKKRPGFLQRKQFSERREMQISALHLAAESSPYAPSLVSISATPADQMALMLAVYKSLQSEGHGEISRRAGKSKLETIMEKHFHAVGVDLKDYDYVSAANRGNITSLSDSMKERCSPRSQKDTPKAQVSNSPLELKLLQDHLEKVASKTNQYRVTLSLQSLA